MPFESLGAVSYLLSIVTMAVSVAVYEIFSVRTMAFKVIGNGTIWQIVYEFLLAYHCNYGPILYRLRDYSELLVENCKKIIPNLYLAPPHEVTPSKFRTIVWCPYNWNDWATVWWRNCDNMLSRFHRIPEPDKEKKQITRFIACTI